MNTNLIKQFHDKYYCLLNQRRIFQLANRKYPFNNWG